MLMEIVKLISIPALSFYFYQASPVILATAGYSIISVIWLMVIKPDITNSKQLNSAKATN